jgi:hypothetical protein
VGQWNKSEVFYNNGFLKFCLNGILVVSTVLWDDNRRSMIAGSKFKNMPDSGKFEKGKIAL